MNVLGFQKKIIVDNTSATEKADVKKVTRNRATRGGTSETVALGKRLRELRKAKGIKPHEIYSALKISDSAYNNYETGKGVMPAIFVKPICEILGISVSELFDYTVTKDKPKEETPQTNEDKIKALEKMVMSLIDEMRNLK